MNMLSIEKTQLMINILVYDIYIWIIWFIELFIDFILFFEYHLLCLLNASLVKIHYDHIQEICVNIFYFCINYLILMAIEFLWIITMVKMFIYNYFVC